MNKTKDTIRVL